MFNIKTISRIAAVQTLYQYFYLGDKDNIEDIISSMIILHKKSTSYNNFVSSESEQEANKSIKINVNFYKTLVSETVANLNILDDKITKNLEKDESFAQLEPLLLALLRTALAENIIFPSTPRKVIINEYTDIASEMLNPPEIGFINFILDKITLEEKNG